MDKARHLYPEDIFPLVQEGKNKIITLDQLLHEMHEMIEHHHHDCGHNFEDPCSCEKALYEAKQADTKAAEALCNSLEALDSAKSAFLAANKAFDLSKETKTLAENNESRITSLESNLCSINVRLDVLDKKIDDTAAKVKVTMKAVESSTDYQYTFYQGINQVDSNIVGIVTVPKTDATLTLAGKPADAAAVGQQFTNIKDLIEQVKNELNTTQAGSGLSTTGEYIKNVTAHYINNAASLADADTILDQAIYDSNIKIDKNVQDISDLKVSVTNLSDKVYTLNANVITLTNNVADLSTKVTDLSTKVTDLDTKVTAVVTDVTALKTSVADLTTKVTDLTTTVTNLSTKVDTNTANIATNTTNIAAINTKLDNSSTLTLKAGKFTESTYNPFTGDKQVNIPTKASDLTNDLQTITFAAGKFADSTLTSYNGSVAGTLKIPTNISDLEGSVTTSGVKTATILKNNVSTTVNPDANGNLDLTGIDQTKSLTGLTTDVTLTTPTTGDVLYYNGTKWINTNLSTLITDKVNELIDAKLLWTRVASDATTTSESGYVLKPKVAANDAISVGYAYSTNA